MRTPGRLMPHVALGLLTLLAVGAVVLSLVQAPPVAATLLHAAAGNTAATSSLAIQESVSQVVDGRSTLLETLDARVEPPDRIELMQRGVYELGLGTRTYVSTDRGATWIFDTSGSMDVPRSIAAVLAPLQLLRQATGVTASHGQTRFTFRTTTARVVAVMHLTLSTVPGQAPVPVSVTVRGEFVTAFAVHLTLDGQYFLLAVHYTHLDRLPPLVAPLVTNP